MIKKLLSILKSTVLLWLCILIPLMIGMKIIEMRTERDAKACLDSFIQTECVGLSKNISLQFLSTYEKIINITDELQLNSFENEEITPHDVLKELVKNNNNLLSMHIYRADGKFFASSGDDELADASLDEIPSFVKTELENRAKKKADNNKKEGDEAEAAAAEEEEEEEKTKKQKVAELTKEVSYSIDQLEDSKEIVLKFYAPLRLEIKDKETDEMKEEDFFIEITEKWQQYEKYMDELQQGSFPRMFYIISPDCKRYISLNSFPDGAKSQRSVMALGMHLTSKINGIAAGFSDQNIEGLKFRLFKDDIRMPQKMKGNNFYMVVAADDMALANVIESLISGTSVVLIILVMILLLISIVMAKFHSDTKDQQEISETITEATPLAVIIFKASDGKIFQINLSAKTAQT